MTTAAPYTQGQKVERPHPRNPDITLTLTITKVFEDCSLATDADGIPFALYHEPASPEILEAVARHQAEQAKQLEQLQRAAEGDSSRA